MAIPRANTAVLGASRPARTGAVRALCPSQADRSHWPPSGVYVPLARNQNQDRDQHESRNDRPHRNECELAALVALCARWAWHAIHGLEMPWHAATNPAWYVPIPASTAPRQTESLQPWI